MIDRLGIPDFSAPRGGSDIGDAEEAARHISYSLQPAHAGVSLLRAGERLDKELFRIHCPTLILHGARDRGCPIENSWRFARQLGTRDQRVIILPRSGHIITRDLDRAQVKAELRAFLLRLTSRSREAVSQ